MTTSTTSQGHGLLSELYPSGGWRRWLFRAPLYLWRMGLGWMLPRQILALTTTGRKSGLPRHIMIEFTYANDKIYLASGWGTKPQWVRNVLADPVVTVQSMAHGTIHGTARRVTDEAEFASLWEPLTHSPIMTLWLESYGVQPTREDYLAKRDRLVVFAIEPGDVPAPPPLEQDLAWIPTMMAAMVLLRVLRGGDRKKEKRRNAKARRRRG